VAFSSPEAPPSRAACKARSAAFLRGTAGIVPETLALPSARVGKQWQRCGCRRRVIQGPPTPRELCPTCPLTSVPFPGNYPDPSHPWVRAVRGLSVLHGS